MDKNIIKKHLTQKFVNEAKGETNTPGISVTKAVHKKSGEENKKGVKDIDKNLSAYEGSLKKGMETTKVPNKFNYNSTEEEEYHTMMEIGNGQEMIRYDRINKEFEDRAKQALEGSEIMGNKGGKDMGNAEATWGASSDDFGKNFAKNAKKSFKKKLDAETGYDSFGDDIERVPKGAHPMGKFSALAENKNNNKPQIKEGMKRLNFKKEFNGVGNALKMIPESYRVDNKTFEMSDGVENYKIRWEGTLTEGRAIVLMASDKTMVNEDMAHMKHLMGYKSNETLGTVKGKARLDENKMFTDIWSKTRDLMEGSDIESVKAKTGNLEDIKKKAPEATKHVQGSVSKDKGTQAPAAKEGDLDDAVSQAPEAKKHVQGSVSTEKGTKAPAPKKGEWEGVKKKATEATKHVTMKESFNSEEDEEIEDDENQEDVTTENVETSEPKAKGGKHWDIKLPHAKDAKKDIHMFKGGEKEGIKLGENYFTPMSENLDEYGDEHEMTRDDAEAQMAIKEYGDEHEMSREDADADSLKQAAFEFANSAEMDKITDDILSKMSPQDIEQLQGNLSQLTEGSIYESDFGDFSGLVDSLQSQLNENDEKSQLKVMVGNLLSRFGRLNAAFMGTLPIVVNLAMNSMGLTDYVIGRGEGALAMAASIIAAGVLWRLGDKLRGKEGTI